MRHVLVSVFESLLFSFCSTSEILGNTTEDMHVLSNSSFWHFLLVFGDALPKLPRKMGVDHAHVNSGNNSSKTKDQARIH